MRFEKIISALGKVDIVAEVGCDHAKLTELAFVRGLCSRAIVSDISEKCLEKARRTLTRSGDLVEYAVCDGVPEPAYKAECIVICGMGGHLIRAILSRYDGDSGLLLSPQSHSEVVRRELAVKGYRIIRDECFEADGKFYDLITAERGDMQLDMMSELYGVHWKEPNAALRRKLKIRLDNVLGGGDRTADEAERIREVLRWQR